jgi:hypothetical protein
MTIKPNRTVFEKTEEDKVQFRKRKQEEKEHKEALKDFLLEQERNKNAPVDEI